VLGLEPGQTAWRILVVEDNIENRLLLSGLLTAIGFEIREAENGEQGAAIFEQWRPHFIWMDMRMPVMDGYHATAKIRALPGGDAVKIVAITASAFKEQHHKILAAGCDQVVHKPFRSHEIFDAMAEHLGVRFLYEKETEAEQAAPAITTTSEMVAGLSAELRQALTEAARNLDIAATAQVIEEIRSDHPEIADGLQLLAESFRFGQILELLNKTG